jgi:hypothetical protein
MRRLARRSREVLLVALAVASCERSGGASEALAPTISVVLQDSRTECKVVDGHVSCRGNGSRGLFGTGTAVENSDSFRAVDSLHDVTALDVSATALFACAVTRGEVWCWGDNVAGTLGRSDARQYEGTQESLARPQRVDSLPPSRTVELGPTHACALTNDGRVFCWGMNSVGEVKDPRAEPRFAVTSPVEVSVPSNVTELYATVLQSCVATSRAELHCWGGSVPGADGPVPAFTPSRVAHDILERPREMADGHTCVKTKAGDVCWEYAANEVLRLYQDPYLARQK